MRRDSAPRGRYGTRVGALQPPLARRALLDSLVGKTLLLLEAAARVSSDAEKMYGADYGRFASLPRFSMYATRR